ncbi:MAG: ABC transporter ATP-binding protein [Hydrogenothermaceae bacterium]
MALLGSLIEAGSLAGLTYLVKDIIDRVFIEKDLEKLKFVLIVIISLALFKQIGFILKEYVYPYALFKVLKQLRQEIFLKLINGRYSDIQSRQFGDILSRSTNDLEAFRNSMILVGVDFITQLFTVIGMIGVLIYRDYQLFLIFLIATPIFALSFNYFGNKRKKYSQKVQESFAEYTQTVNQTLSGLETIKVFSKKVIESIFEKVNQNLFKNQRKNALYDVLYLSSLEIASYIGVAGIILYGGISIINGRITTGDLFSFLSALLILVNSLQILQRGAIQFKVLTPVVLRIKEILNISTEREEGTEFEEFKEKIEFKDLYLRIGQNKILDNINTVIKKGQKIGVVGHTGSGKSSFIKLIYGLYDNYEGNIYFDKTQLRQINIRTLREKIGVLSQDVFIFNDTVKNNLLIAKPDATDEEITKALIKAKAEFILKLPNGLDTILGERGSSLSGGERQRLALARVYLKDPQIVIIDEGTSALDPKTEEEVINQLYNHFKDRTLIIVAHRISTLKMCDRILTFENGKIIKDQTSREFFDEK